MFPPWEEATVGIQNFPQAALPRKVQGNPGNRLLAGNIFDIGNRKNQGDPMGILETEPFQGSVPENESADDRPVPGGDPGDRISLPDGIAGPWFQSEREGPVGPHN